MSDLSALLVSYAFPPVGGAGVQRSVKLAKYLPDHGVKPSVLTVSNPSVPLTDATLEKDFPPGLVVTRARTFEPGYSAKQATWQANADARPTLKQRVVRQGVSVAKQLLVPDPQLLWLPGAAQALYARTLRDPPDVVFITAPPFSQFLLGPLVRLARRSALVLDYRDEWSTARSTYEMLEGGLADRVGEQLETRLVHSATYVTTATEEFRENLLARFPKLSAERVVAIPNGYDPDDYPDELPEPSPDKLTLVYAGTLFKLTSAQGLLRAIRRLAQREPELAKHLDVRFIGRIVDTELEHFEGMEELGVQRLGYVPHDQVLTEVAQAHIALCLLDEVPGVERIYPAKIFELMHLKRPVLTLAPEGALTRLVQRCELGPVLGPRDEEAICQYLERCVRQLLDGSLPREAKSNEAETARYHRHTLAGELARVLRHAQAQGPVPR